MSASSIEWTELTWNPTTGCDKISAGCKHCYAEIMSRRLQAMGVPKYEDGFAVRWHEDALDVPRSWRKPSVVFVNSMSDLFHDDVALDFIQRVFRVMNECQQHVFQVLTKRAERLEKIAGKLKWTPNIWMGVSVGTGVMGTGVRREKEKTFPDEAGKADEVGDWFIRAAPWLTQPSA